MEVESGSTWESVAGGRADAGEIGVHVDRGEQSGRRRAQLVDGVIAVGLTGAVGAGKSTALAVFADLGALTFSADEAVHRIYERPEMRAALRARLGNEVLGAEGSVDRRAVSRRVTGDEEALRWLEALVHPMVAHEIRSFLASVPLGSVVVCEVPLLVEVQTEPAFGLVVAIEAPADLRRRRVAGRLSEEAFAVLDSRQATPAQRAVAADYVFVNDGSAVALREFVVDVYRNSRALLEAETREMSSDDSRSR